METTQLFGGPAPALPIANKGNQPLVFIVDDDSDDKELLIEALSELNNDIRYLTAWNGQEAIDMLIISENEPDYIFLDIHMPCMDGKQCLKEIRRHNRFDSIPVVILSGSEMQEDVNETLGLGADFFFTKPNSYHELQNIVAHVINRF